MALLEKAAALYFNPDSIGDDQGARCGICWKFNPAGSCLEVLGVINGEKGICGLYVNGDPSGDVISSTVGLTVNRISKSEAGYVEQGPTHCANCDEMLIPRLFGESRCKKVEGMVEGRGCCTAAWEPKK